MNKLIYAISEIERNGDQVSKALKTLIIALDRARGRDYSCTYLSYLQLTRSNNWLKMHGLPKRRKVR